MPAEVYWTPDDIDVPDLCPTCDSQCEWTGRAWACPRCLGCDEEDECTCDSPEFSIAVDCPIHGRLTEGYPSVTHGEP